MSAPAPAPAPTAWLIRAGAAENFRLWGLGAEERLRRALSRAGCGDLRVLDAAGEEPRAGLLLRCDWILDERLIESLVTAAPGTALVAREAERPLVAARVDSADFEAARAALCGEAPPPAHFALRLPHELAASYSAKLRKFDPPFLLPARSELLDELERRTFAASYKGATDLVTKWLWPAPARALTRRFAEAGVHPNTITLVSWGLAIAAFFLFWQGWFATGLALAWLMTFLDTVDGKLARVTLTSSKLGNVLDHGLDLVHPPFWWYAWAAGLGAEESLAMWIVVGGYFGGRLLEGLFLLSFDFEMHCWRPIDTLFRTITARRNPNLIFFSVGTLFGRPDQGLLLVALWTALCMAFHLLRLQQAWIARAAGRRVAPWDENLRGAAPAPAPVAAAVAPRGAAQPA